jgi:multidrug efflux pump subunit AcrA (membrane-fusion protein)
VGQPVQVIVRTALEIKGASVPRAAITKNRAGEAVVWVHREAERFVASRVRFQSLDAVSVAITDGLTAGDRVVTEGSGLLAQVRYCLIPSSTPRSSSGCWYSAFPCC